MNKEEQEFKKEVDETLHSIYSKINEEEKIFLSYLVNQFNNICERNNKAIEYNEQIIKDTKSFYRPTEDTIYSGDCLIDIATQNINYLKGNNETQ